MNSQRIGVQSRLIALIEPFGNSPVGSNGRMKNVIVYFSILSMLLSGLANAKDFDKDLTAEDIEAVRDELERAKNEGNSVQAINLMRPLAEKGFASAQGLLGQMYLGGDGVTQNYQEAVKWFRLAATQGEEFSQYMLGSIYDEGEGVSQDYGQAVYWYKKAAAQGNTKAQAKLFVLLTITYLRSKRTPSAAHSIL